MKFRNLKCSTLKLGEQSVKLMDPGRAFRVAVEQRPSDQVVRRSPLGAEGRWSLMKAITVEVVMITTNS